MHHCLHTLKKIGSMRLPTLSATLTTGFILLTLASQCYGNSISVGYYKGKCGKHDVEKIIFDVIKATYAKDSDTVSDLIRLQFHDCVVRGCDASVLLDGKHTEKTAQPNLSLGGFDTVDAAKKAVEKVCPEVVSCADVLTIAARSAVFAAGGKWYDVETGRRDSLVSHRHEAVANVPPPTIPVPKAIELFEKRGLTKDDMVVLLGGHTVGTAHCDKFKKRLYNFHHTGKPDARIPPSFLKTLKQTCPRHSRVNNETFLDQTPGSHFIIDNAYYKEILSGKGVLEIDENLATSSLTGGLVKELAYTPGHFLDKFGPAMVKMGRIGVLTGNKGEIRKSCRHKNHRH